ncbi:MAG: response regulator transcription factor [Rhodothermales bacterium]|nr:response regulator transcription factor [Rhodothermales bacterium]
MMAEMLALVVDDEPLGRERLRQLSEDRTDIVVVAEASNRVEAIHALRRSRFDLVFLDIQMPNGSGFDVLTEIGIDKMPPTIFVTAHDSYAAKAFEVHAVDYILKPVEKERFDDAVDRVIQSNERSGLELSHGKLQALVAQMEIETHRLQRIMVRTNDKIRFVRCVDIDWVESAGNYVKIWTNGKSYLVRRTMKSLEEALDPNYFVRIHRSTIVNLERVETLSPMFSGDYRVHLTVGKDLTMSRGYKHVIERFS